MMNAAEYNVQEIRAGRVSVAQLAAFVDANELVEAVKVFQGPAGLKADGRLTPETLKALEPKFHGKINVEPKKAEPNVGVAPPKPIKFK